MSSLTYRGPIAVIPVGPVTSAKFPVRASVSVIIPCYNEERFIGKARENLAGQSWPEHYEIIVVDGMSNGQTPEVLRKGQPIHAELSVRLIAKPRRKIRQALNLR